RQRGVVEAVDQQLVGGVLQRLFIVKETDGLSGLRLAHPCLHECGPDWRRGTDRTRDPAPRSRDAEMVALFEDGPNLVKAAGGGRTSGMGGVLAVRFGQLMNGIEDQQNQADKEAEAAPILEVIVPPGRYGQRQNGKDSQQKNHSNLGNLFHESDPGSPMRRAKKAAGRSEASPPVATAP